jgi:flagellar basal body P-ring formation protein FlgA
VNRFKCLVWFWVIFLFWICPLSIKGVPQKSFSQAGEAEEGKPVEMEQIKKILETYFQKVFPDQTRHVEIRDIRGYEKAVLPPVELSVEVLVSERARSGGNISALILFLANGREIKRLRVTARVDIYADVVVAKNYLKKGQEIGMKDLQIVNRNISTLAPDVVTRYEEILGKRTVLSVNSDEVLRMTMVEVPPLIKKGDRVVLVVESSQFKITSMGESREEGRKGDRVKLVNLSSKKEVFGKILNGNTVQIDY